VRGRRTIRDGDRRRKHDARGPAHHAFSTSAASTAEVPQAVLRHRAVGPAVLVGGAVVTGRRLVGLRPAHRILIIHPAAVGSVVILTGRLRIAVAVWILLVAVAVAVRIVLVAVAVAGRIVRVAVALAARVLLV